MTDFKQLSERTDTSVAILRAIADQRGDDQDAIEEALENPEDFDAIITRARENASSDDLPLRWQGREIL
jgi:hypothetical protein